MSVISAVERGAAIGNAFSLIARFGKFFVFAVAPRVDDGAVDSEGNRKSFLFKCPERFHKRLREAIPNFLARSDPPSEHNVFNSVSQDEKGGFQSIHLAFILGISVNCQGRPNEDMSESVGVVVDACRRSEKEE